MPRNARALALAASISLALLASAPGAAAAGIRVCENSRYRQPCVELRHGVNDLRDWGISNRISSFSIDSGAWLMCTERDFRGRCEVFSGSVDNLKGSPFQDAISSLRPVREGGGGNWGGWGGSNEWQRIGIAVYTDRNFRGRSWVFSDDVRDLGRLGLNNQISSVRILGGRWRICRERDLRGCIELTGDVPNLRNIGFNDQISSIEELGPVGWGGGGGHGGGHGGSGGGWGGSGGSGSGGGGWGGSNDRAELFEEPGFRGRSIRIEGEVSNLSDQRFNDRTRSIRLRGGSWQLCSDSRFRGRCVIARGDVEDLSRLGLPGSLSSLRPQN